MRLRFFAIILCTLLLTTGAVIYMHIYFFRDQPMETLDAQIHSSAQSLVHSRLDEMPSYDFQATDREISEQIGDKRIGKIFIIRDANDAIIFRSSDVSVLKLDLPRDRDWVTINGEKHFVRIFNARFPHHPERILQVAAVLDPQLLDWNVINLKMVTYIGVVVFLIFIMAAGLSFVLLSPLRALSHHLAKATVNLKNLNDIGPMPPSLLRFSKSYWAGADDFSIHIGIVQKLIDRINANYRLTRSWTFQMAHELKTPLTLIKSEVESGTRNGSIDAGTAGHVNEQIDRMSDIMTQFLDWADIENSKIAKEIHANRLVRSVERARPSLEKLFPHRLNLSFRDDPVVLSNSLHLEQMVFNLIHNALKYSPAERPVDVVVEAGEIRIADRGPGIPPTVMERMGQPFNVGPNVNREFKSNGLGLAWASSVAKTYDWNLNFDTGPSGTTVIVKFADAVTAAELDS